MCACVPLRVHMLSVWTGLCALCYCSTPVILPGPTCHAWSHLDSTGEQSSSMCTCLCGCQPAGVRLIPPSKRQKHFMKELLQPGGQWHVHEWSSVNVCLSVYHLSTDSLCVAVVFKWICNSRLAATVKHLITLHPTSCSRIFTYLDLWMSCLHLNTCSPCLRLGTTRIHPPRNSPPFMFIIMFRCAIPTGVPNIFSIPFRVE